MAAIAEVIADATRKDPSHPLTTWPKSEGRREERDETQQEAGADYGFLLCRTEGGA
jgi:hypothetical protein